MPFTPTLVHIGLFYMAMAFIAALLIRYRWRKRAHCGKAGLLQIYALCLLIGLFQIMIIGGVAFVLTKGVFTTVHKSGGK